MNLSTTDLPADVIATLRALNIREVESLLSMVATPLGAAAMARVLGMPVESVRDLEANLRGRYPDLEVTAATGALHPMGHRPPSRKP